MSPYFTAMLVAVISPAILAIISNFLSGQQRAREKQLDWDREDEVANRLLAANKRVAKDSEQVKDKLDQIHTLVNSNLTAAMRARLEATIGKLVVMKKLASRDEDHGLQISVSDQNEIEKTQKEIDQLTAELNDRLKQSTTA